MATNNASVDEWLTKTPNNTIYLFFSFDVTYVLDWRHSHLFRYLAEDAAAAERMSQLQVWSTNNYFS